MAQDLELEMKVLSRFVTKARRSRFEAFLSNPKNRWKFALELPFFRDFKWELFRNIAGNEEQAICQALKNYSLPGDTCYVISRDREIDMSRMPVRAAIGEMRMYLMGTILVFGDAQLIAWGGEFREQMYLSSLFPEPA